MLEEREREKKAKEDNTFASDYYAKEPYFRLEKDIWGFVYSDIIEAVSRSFVRLPGTRNLAEEIEEIRDEKRELKEKQFREKMEEFTEIKK